MGGSSYSDSHYTARAADRAAKGVDAFAHSKSVASKPVHLRAAHATMSPKGVKIRESRDSDTHPNSKAIVISLDVTGSIRDTPIKMQQALPKLMGLLIRQAGLVDAQIMIMAIGDTHSDAVPLQVGQFESGLEIEDNLMNIYMEGNGGGNPGESYNLGMYFIARHTAIDCMEKRGEKGYMFIIGDEPHYPVTTRGEIEKEIGDTLEADVKIEDIYAELSAKYEVFYIMPAGTSNYKDARAVNQWKKLLGDQRVFFLEDPNAICELIAGTVSLMEGSLDHDGVSTALAKEGLSASAGAVGTALANIKASVKAGVKGSVISVPSSGAASGLI